MYKIIALFLITSQYGEFSDYLANQELTQATRSLTIEMQLIDRFESMFYVSAGYSYDLKVVRDRYRILSTTPKIEFAKCFPGYDDANACCAFALQYINHCEEMPVKTIAEYEACNSLIRETRGLYYAWDLLREAQDENLDVYTRRLRLMCLRDELGYEKFYQYKMPYHVPVRVFEYKDE